MKQNIKLLIIIVCVGFFSFASFSYAAEPTLILSWKANTYIPKVYNGKALPTKESYIDISIMAISNDKLSIGKILNLSNKQIRWYVNNDLVFRSVGLTHIRIKNNMDFGSEIDVRVAVEHYDKSTGNTSFIEKYISITVISPKVSIIKNIFKSDDMSGSLGFIALPLFFNAKSLSDLSIIWSINGSDIKSSNQYFNLEIKNARDFSVGKMSIEATVKNNFFLNEFASYVNQF